MKQLKKGLGMGKSLNDSAKNEYGRDEKKTNFLHSFYIALLEKVEKVSGAINKKLQTSIDNVCINSGSYTYKSTFQ